MTMHDGTIWYHWLHGKELTTKTACYSYTTGTCTAIQHSYFFRELVDECLDHGLQLTDLLSCLILFRLQSQGSKQRKELDRISVNLQQEVLSLFAACTSKHSGTTIMHTSNYQHINN